MASPKSTIKKLQGTVTELTRARESDLSTIAVMERKLDDLTYLSISSQSSTQKEILPIAKRDATIKRLRILRHENPLAKQAVKLIIRFTLGRGITYVSKDPDCQETLDSFWNDPTNQTVLTNHLSMQNRLDEVVTDGEQFIAMFPNPGIEPFVKLSTIPMEEIVDIIYDPDNAHIPVYYKRCYYPLKYDAQANGGYGGWTRVDESKVTTKYYRDYRITDDELKEITNLSGITEVEDVRILHRMVNPLKTKFGVRGISELFASREWFRVFKEFVEDRAAINASANAFSYVRKVKGGASAVASISGKIGGIPMGQDQPDSTNLLRTLSRPVGAAIYDSNEGVDLSTIRADTGAVDARQDAMLLLMAAGAGVATNAQYFGEGGDANLATAQSMELPMVKSYEDWQQSQQEFLLELFKFVLMTAHSVDTVAELDPEDLDISMEFPAIITEDVVKYITSWAQLAQQVAPGNTIVKEIAIRGALTTLHVANVEKRMPEIVEEEKRVQDEKDAQAQAQLDAMMNPNDPTGTPVAKKPPPEGQKAGDGGGVVPLGPDLQRIANGKKPRIPASGPRK